jgi:hypothetical protein
MGQRGPIPERESNLARPRERKGSDEQAAKRGQLQPIAIDWQPDPEWSDFTRNVWDSASASGMADFYQDTDYAELWFICQELDRYTKPKVNTKTGELWHKQSPEMVKALLTGLSNLGFTEGDRRRIRIELDAPEPEATSASVTALHLYSGALDNAAQPPEGDEEGVPGE